MNETTNRQIGDLESKLSLLLREIKGGPIEPRVQLWIQRMCSNRKLGEWVQDAKVPDKDKLTVLRSLIDLLLTKAYDRLPEDTGAPITVRGLTADETSALLEKAREPSPEPEMPAPDEIRAMVRQEVRLQLAAMLEMIASALREAK